VRPLFLSNCDVVEIERATPIEGKDYRYDEVTQLAEWIGIVPWKSSSQQTFSGIHNLSDDTQQASE